MSIQAPKNLTRNRQFSTAIALSAEEPAGDTPPQDNYMGFSIAPLLIHNDEIPLAARHALVAATFGSAQDRTALLETAARAIYLETDLNCRDARELVGLEAGASCR